MPRNATEWAGPPKFPPTHYVDARIYSNPEIFEEEKEKVFRPCWIVACHESEVPNAYDYRLFTHPSGVPLIVVRGDDDQVRAFYNICPHRGNAILYDPSGNAKRMTCIFHQWSFDTRGSCVDISRAEQGYQQLLKGRRFASRSEVRGRLRRLLLGEPRRRELHVARIHRPGTRPAGAAHAGTDGGLRFHKAVVNTNFKLWHDTNSEFYHDFLHYFNHVTGMMQPGYFDRKYTGYPNGHASVGSMWIKYDAYDGSSERIGWPGLAPGR